MHDEGCLGVKPFGALSTIMPSKTRQIFWRLAVLVLLEMFWRQQIGLDLINVPAVGQRQGALANFQSQISRYEPPVTPRLGYGALIWNTHFRESICQVL